MYFDVSLVRHQHPCMSHHTYLMVYHVTLRKRHPLVAKEDHPFENSYDKSMLSLECGILVTDCWDLIVTRNSTIAYTVVL